MNYFYWEGMSCLFLTEKNVRVVKLTLLMLTVVLFNISAETYAQSTRINLEMTNSTVKEVLKGIEEKSEFTFFYNDKVVNTAQKVSVHAENEKIEEILSDILPDCSFRVDNKKIILTRKAVKSVQTTQQKRTITGTIIDDSGYPVIGANVIVKGTTIGVITDIDGKYSLELSGNVKLMISYIGYVSQELMTGNKSILNVTMREDTQALDEVVVVGYGIQKKINLTGAVTAIDKEVLESRPTASIVSALQGTVPGLTISASGAPGSSSTIRLRGQGSLSNEGKTPPYILIDGVSADEEAMLGLNPDDVENISVLKDAAASAIYGARAAFGVILITTKSGSGKKDKLEVNYSNNLDFAAFTVIPDMTNSVQFAHAYNDAYANAGKTGMFTEEWFVKAQRKIDDPTAPGTEPYSNNPSMWKRNFESFDNVDWYDVYYKPGYSAFQQKHTLSLSGTTEKINYYVSAGLRDNVSNMRHGDWKNTQYSGLARLNSKVNKWLDLGLNIRYANGVTMEPTGTSDGTGTWLIYHNIWRSWPMTFLQAPDGNYNFQTTVPWLINGGTTAKTRETVVLTPSFRIKPLEGWVINFDLTTNMDFNTTKSDRQNIPEWQTDGTINQATWNSKQKSTYASKEFTRTSYLTYNLYTSYEKQINDHFISGMVGVQQEESKFMKAKGTRNDLLFPSLPTMDLSGGDRSVSDEESEWSTFGSFMRISYNYKNRYLLEANGRYDASAKFREGNRWGFFPSFSLGYNISQEEFWKPIEDYVSSFKIRLSSGKLGNQNVSSFTFLPQMDNGTTDFIMGGLRPVYIQAPGLINNALTWEKSQTLNIGLDAGFFANKLTFTMDAYDRRTYDMFGPSQKLPAVIGAKVPEANNSSLSTKGLELSLAWRDRIGDFSYDVMATLSDYQTTITEFYNPTGTMTTWSEGRKLGEIWGYETDRFFAEDDFIKSDNGTYKMKENVPNQDYIYSKWSPGDIKYVDQNGDGKINKGNNTVDDRGDLVLLGNSTPRFQYGFNIGAQYKGFDLRLFLQGVGKKDVWIEDATFWGFESRAQSNLSIQHLDYWTPENTDAYYPKPYLEGDSHGKNTQKQSKYLLDGSYLRLKNIQLGYSIPSEWLKKISLTRARFYMSGENLLTFSNFPDFYDPEVYGKVHPMQKHISFGVNVSF
jgi:TonB-linked SusC/RagA family outer membrane protein